MPLFQPPLHPPPAEATVEGQTVIITGANSGIGLETSRQLLQRRAATVILAVRNVHKGEQAKALLLSDPIVREMNPAANVSVMELDLADYSSVARFATAVTATLPALHLLLLNAGCGGNHSANTRTCISTATRTDAADSFDRSSSDSSTSISAVSSAPSSSSPSSPLTKDTTYTATTTSSGIQQVQVQTSESEQPRLCQHERTLQVNYLSNVLLLLSLLPLLRATAALAGRPSRVTWTGCRAHALTARTTVARLATHHLSPPSSSSSSLPPSSPSSSLSWSLLASLDAAAQQEQQQQQQPQLKRQWGLHHSSQRRWRHGQYASPLSPSSPQPLSPLARYADSKLLAVLFLYELRRRLPAFTRSCDNGPADESGRGRSCEGEGGGGGDGGVVINMFCPGMVDTRIGDALPWYLRWPLDAVKAVRARSVTQAAWVAVHAAVVAGTESHGRFFGDKEEFGETEFIKSEEGKRVRAMLWEETVEEMSKVMDVPRWMKEPAGGTDR